MELISKYFPDLTKEQAAQFAQLGDLYTDWNSKINVISRKDIENIYLHHVLHSLAIAKVTHFKPGSKLLDVGTGGGFPGIPLAIMFPDCQFHLIDAIGKKISVVNGVAQALGLTNVKGEHTRVEQVKQQYDFVLSRAVTRFDTFWKLCRKNVSKDNFNDLHNGILYLKGGDFEEELEGIKNRTSIYAISDYFSEDFFDTKKIIHLIIR